MKNLSQVLCRRRNNAKKRGIEFTLTLEEFKKLREIKTCFYTGVDLVLDLPVQQSNSWTLDRADNKLRYIYSNVVVCSYEANQEKSRTFDEARNRTHNPILAQQIADKLKMQPRVAIQKQSKLSRIWKIITE